ncbi:MAG: hypothetical protein DRJ20_02020 [Candidatus Methanomethylicota archaeon]|uniref:Flagellar biosynthesis protein FlaG n=1 Tax=Thermoproteota archaeon TaxID=2056631 RepID=A0A497EVW0_9CREN|nr:MAG: hypothetical protein DRJ20_02020 [Candidatus Verstraetearchaeota archaeon]
MNSKGSSTVLGALLFIIIAISVASFTFSLSLDYQKKWKDYLKRQELRQREKIEIVSVENVGLDTYIKVINIGGEAVKIAAVYINHRLIEVLDEFYIPSGSERTIIIKNFNIEQGDYIKITTDRGNFATYYVTG